VSKCHCRCLHVKPRSSVPAQRPLLLRDLWSKNRSKWPSSIRFWMSPHVRQRKEGQVTSFVVEEGQNPSPVSWAVAPTTQQLSKTVLNCNCTYPLNKILNFVFFQPLKELRGRNLLENCVFPSSCSLVFHITLHVSTEKLKTAQQVSFFG